MIRLVTKSFPRLLRKQVRSGNGWYSSISLTDEEIARRDYMQYLGGGAEQWDARGAFQLHLLQERGLQESSKVLDVGCGPLRAGKHLITFLNEGCYYGVDYNEDFVRAARNIVDESGLASKRPTIEVIQDFSFGNLVREFNYALVFSVLNHCDEQQKKLFFNNIARTMKPGGKIFISHGDWFNKSYISDEELIVANTFGLADVALEQFGWSDTQKAKVVPIIELEAA